MRFKKIVLVLILMTVIFFSCSKKNTRLLLNESEYYDRILKQYKKGDYIDFRKNADYFKSDYPGNSQIPYIQYLIAESYFDEEDFAKAISEYNKILYKYPDSNYLNDAYYKIGLSYFKQKRHPQRDQTNTEKAIYYLNKVVEQGETKYSKKAKEMINKCRDTLAKKEFYRARFYFRRKSYDVSINILNEAINEYSDTPTVADLYYLMAKNYFRKREKDKAYSFIKKAKSKIKSNSKLMENIEELQEDLKELE